MPYFGTPGRTIAHGDLIANEAVPVATACADFLDGDFVIFTVKTIVGASELPTVTSTTPGVGFSTVTRLAQPRPITTR